MLDFWATPDILLYGLAGYSEMRINNWNLSYVILAGGPVVHGAGIAG